MRYSTPEHFSRFSSMKPRIGEHYDHSQHKRLLIIGESHYLPHESNVHEKSSSWYSKMETELSSTEKKWISTESIISESKKDGFTNKAHSIYRNISWELNELGLAYETFQKSIEHCLYYNYFQRPAKYGDSLLLDTMDIEVANQTLNWIISKDLPELVIITSSLAGYYAGAICEDRGLDFCITPHPGCAWWNRSAKKYGGLRGRDLFRDFLLRNHWLK